MTRIVTFVNNEWLTPIDYTVAIIDINYVAITKHDVGTVHLKNGEVLNTSQPHHVRLSMACHYNHQFQYKAVDDPENKQDVKNN